MSVPESIGILVHYGGEIVSNGYQVTYDRCAIGATRISRTTSFGDLLRLLYEITQISDQHYILKVFAKYCDNNMSRVVSISNDRDLSFFLHPDTGNHSLDLFVEKEQILGGVEMTLITQGMSTLGVGVGTSNIMNDGCNVSSDNSDYSADDHGDNPRVDSEPDDSGPDDSESDDDGGDGYDGNITAHQTVVNVSTQHEHGRQHVSSIPFLGAQYEDVDADSIDIPGGTSLWYDPDRGVLKKGMVFKDKEHVQQCVRDYSVRWAKREFRVIESTPAIWKVVCKQNRSLVISSTSSSQQCNWWLRASFSKKHDLWCITQYGGRHSCLMRSTGTDHHNLCKNLIVVDLMAKVQVDAAYKIKAVQEDVFKKYDYKISYHKAWHSLKRARENVYGTWESSVRHLPKYMQALQKYNPGTIVEWLHLETNRPNLKMLRYVFWAFRPCIDGFVHCRKVISVDATHLYTKYKHKLLIAVTLDASQKILPLAYAIVDDETLPSWHWFLYMVAKHVVRGIEGVCLISDRHTCILSAVRRVPEFNPPMGVHRFFLRHICSNFRAKFKSMKLKDLAWYAGAEFRVAIFLKIMEQIKTLNHETHEYLQRIDPAKWTLSHDGGFRCGILTTNCSESINGMLRGTRRLPIAALVQATFFKSVNKFHERLTSVALSYERNQQWPDKIYALFDARQRQGLKFAVQKYSRSARTASVVTIVPGARRVRTFRVNLSTQECSCGEWSQTGVPCPHAMQTCREFNEDAAQFMKEYHNITAFINTYSTSSFEPLPDEEEWDEPSFQLCHNPERREIHTGRDRTTRFRNEMDLPETRERQQYQSQDAAETSQAGPSYRH